MAPLYFMLYRVLRWFCCNKCSVRTTLVRWYEAVAEISRPDITVLSEDRSGKSLRILAPFY